MKTILLGELNEFKETLENNFRLEQALKDILEEQDYYELSLDDKEIEVTVSQEAIKEIFNLFIYLLLL